MRKIFYAPILLIFINACHTNMEADLALMGDDPITVTPVQNFVNEQKLIKEAELKFEVEDLDKMRNMLKMSAAKYHGYVSNESRNNYYNESSEKLSIKVPSQYFDSLLYDFTNFVEHFDTKEIKVKDVTNEYIDLEARIYNKQRLEKRYLNLLENASNLSEMLTIEKKMAEVREEVEQAEGKLQYLKRRVIYSQIDVEFYKQYNVTPTFNDEITAGFTNGWGYLKWSAIGLTNLWPFLLIAIGIWLYVKEKKRFKTVQN